MSQNSRRSRRDVKVKVKVKVHFYTHFYFHFLPLPPARPNQVRRFNMLYTEAGASQGGECISPAACMMDCSTGECIKSVNAWETAQKDFNYH